MTLDEMESALREVLSSTLEQMCFADVQPSPEPASVGDPALVWGTIDLYSPARGALALGVSTALSQSLASSAAGAPAPSPEDGKIFLGELVNVVGGMLLCQLDPSAVPQLGLPGTTAPSAPGEGGRRSFVLEVDGEPMTVVLDG